METAAEAFDVANDLLLIQIREYAESKKAFRDKDILIRDIQEQRDSLQIHRGDMVKVFSKRGFIKAVAVVTKRVKDLQVDGKTIHTIGVPIHWGFAGVGKKGFFANNLTPSVGDANTQTPEYKTFLVNIEKVTGA